MERRTKLIIWTGILSLLFGMLLIGNVSALEWDNQKRVENHGEYGKVIIRDSLLKAVPLGDIAEFTLEENTKFCATDCEAIIKMKVLKSYSNPFQDVRFLVKDKNNWKEGNIRSHQIYLKVGEENVVETFNTDGNCVEISKDNFECETSQVTRTVKKPIWEIYQGQSFDSGEYYFKLTGKKDSWETVDFIPKFMGVEVDEWATWTGYNDITDKIYYYKFNEGSGTVAVDQTGVYTSNFAGTPNWHNGFPGFGNASNYTGTQNFSTFHTPDAIQALNFSLEFRAKLNATSFPFFDAGSAQIGTNFGVTMFTGSRTLNMLRSNGSVTVQNNNILGKTITEDEWHHIVLAKNGTTWRVFFDGVLGFAVDQQHILNEPFSFPTEFASERASPTYYKGSLDQIIWWNRTLTAAEILSANNSDTDGESALTNLTVSLIRPANNTASANASYVFNSTGMISNANLTNATLNIWYENGSLFNQTTNTVYGNAAAFTTLINSTTWTVGGFNINNYKWNAYWCAINATANVCAWAPANFTIIIGAEATANNYNVSALETESQTFITNLTIVPGNPVAFAQFVHGSSQSLGTITSLGGDNYQLSRTIDIPVGTGNKNWNWNLHYSSGLIQSLGSNVQLINATTFAFCNATLTTEAVNYTIYDEIFTSNLINASNFDAQFDYYLGSGTVKKSSSSALTTVQEALFCISPSTSTFNVDATIDVRAAGYNQRIFGFQSEEYSSTTTLQPLYMLNSSVASEVIIKVTDSGFRPLSGVLVEISRYYPGEDEHLLVESQLTDGFGQFVADLVEADVSYKFEFLIGGAVVKTVDEVFVACKQTVCSLTFVIGDDTDDFAQFQEVDGFNYALSFNDSTNIFLYTWFSNDTTTKRLYVERRAFNGTSVVCNVTSVLGSGSLNCAVGSVSASYTAGAYRGDKRVATLSSSVGGDYQTFGKEGLFVSFILLMTMIVGGIWKPPVGIALYLFGFVLISTLKIVYVSPYLLIAQFVIGITFIWALRS